MESERSGALKPIGLLCGPVTSRLIPSEINKNATAFLFHYASITYVADFIRDLTKRDKGDLLPLLQPKSGFLPEAGCGGTELLKMA
jgi:hypothetical protein